MKIYVDSHLDGKPVVVAYQASECEFRYLRIFHNSLQETTARRAVVVYVSIELPFI